MQKNLGYTTDYNKQQLENAGVKDLSYKARYSGKNAPKSPVGGQKDNMATTDYNKQHKGSSHPPKHAGKVITRYTGKTNPAGKHMSHEGVKKTSKRIVTETGYMIMNKGSDTTGGTKVRTLKSNKKYS